MENNILNLNNVSKETIQIIGAELKRRRKYQSKTLVNLSSICSISYISKIENGKIIPKYGVLQELCDEQGISREELNALLEVDSLIDECIEALFFNDKEKIANIYNEIYMLDNYKVNLIKAIYEITYFHFSNVEKLLYSIKCIENVLSKKDFYIYSLLFMYYENENANYPAVYQLYPKLKDCKNNYVLALAAKQMFIAVAKYGLESPHVAYKNYYEKYISLFNFTTEDMYELYIESLINGKHNLPGKIKKELKVELKLKYCLQAKDFEELDELLKVYNPTQYERLLIATAKDDFVLGEKIFMKMKLTSLSAKEAIIANCCNYINRGLDDDLAGYIIHVAAPYALKYNDGIMYKMLLEKLTSLSFVVGKYKAVASMNISYFDMLDKCRLCLH